jgi:tryptophan synthase alpha chain
MKTSSARAGGGLSDGFTPGRASLIAYVMAGYPDRATSLEALRAVARAGADLIEIGVPYADPLADGPVIVEAANAARAAAPGGFGLAQTLDLAAELISGDSMPPVALMTYLNPILKLGLAETARRAADAGVGGFIVPDMPPEAAGPWMAATAEAGADNADGRIDTVFLAAPTSTPQRLALIGRASSGFVYCVSSLGVTGERAHLREGLGELVTRIRSATTLPVAVGFGVGTPEQVTEVSRIAEGVVVGSAIVKRQASPSDLEDFVRALARARDQA